MPLEIECASKEQKLPSALGLYKGKQVENRVGANRITAYISTIAIQLAGT